MDRRIIALALIGMLLVTAFLGCVQPEEAKPTPTPTPLGADEKTIPMPEEAGEGEEVPEMPF